MGRSFRLDVDTNEASKGSGSVGAATEWQTIPTPQSSEPPGESPDVLAHQLLAVRGSFCACGLRADKLEHLHLTGFLKRGLTFHRRLYQAVVALGETGHGHCCDADVRLYGKSEATIHLALKRKNHSTYEISLRRA